MMSKRDQDVQHLTVDNDEPPSKRRKGVNSDQQAEKAIDAQANDDVVVEDSDEDEGTTTLKVTETKGDIFAAPPSSLIIHACNCEGHWGAGIAKAFHDRYPAAYEAYADHCDEHGHSLFGKAQLIPPTDDDESKHFVGCLFTSRSMGRKKDSPTRILAATKPAMEDLLRQVDEWNVKAASSDDDGGGKGKAGEVRMCQINSGLFKVPWAKTKALLETIEVGSSDVKETKVVSRD